MTVRSASAVRSVEMQKGTFACSPTVGGCASRPASREGSHPAPAVREMLREVSRSEKDFTKGGIYSHRKRDPSSGEITR